MAPISQPPPGTGHADGPDTRPSSFESWLDLYGNAEYALYKRDNAAGLSYEDWATSDHVLGPYLYHTTLDVWDETTSDENSDFESDNAISPNPPERKKAKTVTVNGGEEPPDVKASAPTTIADQEEISASARKRRKPRKKYLSEEIVASEDSDELDNSVPDATMPTHPASTSTPPHSTATANGHRKSSGRKLRRKFLSEEVISPEDMEDEVMSVDGAASSIAQATILPRSDPSTPIVTPQEDVSKNSSGRKPRIKRISQASVPLQESEDFMCVGGLATPEANSVAPSLDGLSSSSTRRGLRTRTPAQQRPYFHHAKIFEEAESTATSDEPVTRPLSAKAKSTRLAQVSYPDEEEMGQEFELPDEDGLFDFGMGEAAQPEPKQPKHFKGKGRAWKKDAEDEDEDYAQPKKNKIPKKQQRAKEPKVTKRGRPRKTPQLSEVFVRDSDSEAVDQRGKDKREGELNIDLPAQSTTKSKGGRPRKSDQSTVSRASLVQDEQDGMTTPASKRSTPKSMGKTKASAVPLADEEIFQHKDKGTAQTHEDVNQDSLLSPLRNIRKRRSQGSEGNGH